MSSYRKKKKRCARRRYRWNKARPHGGTSGDRRGNWKDRRARKLWILKTFGTGKTVPCAHCGKKLNYKTLTTDRIVPGCQGGRYTHGNIQPACEFCNKSRNFQQCGIDTELAEALDATNIDLTPEEIEQLSHQPQYNGFSRYRWKKMQRRAA